MIKLVQFCMIILMQENRTKLLRFVIDCQISLLPQFIVQKECIYVILFVIDFKITLHLESSVLWNLHIHPRMVLLRLQASSGGPRVHWPQIRARFKCPMITERITLSLKTGKTVTTTSSQWLGISLCLFSEECES